MQTTFMVILPNLKLGIASNALLTFALSWEEVAVNLFNYQCQCRRLAHAHLERPALQRGARAWWRFQWFLSITLLGLVARLVLQH
jgi:putative spermidine/putrescine transport system permease protein